MVGAILRLRSTQVQDDEGLALEGQLLVGRSRFRETIERSTVRLPARKQAHVLRTRYFARRRRPDGGTHLPHFPPALAAVVVLVVDDKSGVTHHGPDPADAVIAVV